MSKRKNNKKRQKQTRVIMLLCLCIFSILILCVGMMIGKNHNKSEIKNTADAESHKYGNKEIQKNEKANVIESNNEEGNQEKQDTIEATNEELNSETQNKEEMDTIEQNIEIDSVHDLEQRVGEMLRTLSLEEKVAQLFIVLPEQLVENVDCVTAAGEATRDALHKYPVGGIVYLSANLVSTEQTKTMTNHVQQYSMQRLNLPLFLCVDEEGGQVTRLAGKEGFDFPIFDNMSLIGSQGDTQKAYEIGESIGQYLSDLGFNTDFAPVADVLSNPNNQVVRYRSFGENPETVKEMTAAVSRGLKSKNILSAYKHFPGHGDTTADTHEGYAYSNKTKEELYQCELIPFLDGIENKVPFIMVGHISFPNITGDDTPASLSKSIVKDLLIDELHYTGIVITDALNMGAVAQEYSSAQAAVKALNAGVDMLLMPDDFQEAYNGVLSAVQNGELSEERIDEAVYKILKTKMADF